MSEAAYVLDEQVGFLMRLATQRHAAIFQKHMVEGLTPTQFSALIRLAEEAPCSQNHLGRRAAMDIATIKGVVDRLRQKGLVAAEPSPEDKRRTLLTLTPQGNALLSALFVSGQAITRETLDPLSPAEQKTLIRILKRLT